jgi:hypothetical protein
MTANISISPVIKPPAAPAAPPAKFFYDGARYFLDTGREYIPMDRRSFKAHLVQDDCDNPEAEICRVQVENYVCHSGPLAGLNRGPHMAGGQRILATSSPTIIPAAPGPFDTLRAVIEGLLGHDGTQVDIFFGWLKYAREVLLAGSRRNGQALALCGQAGCGKSLLIDILEKAMGGRRANPYPYFSGRTNFNADIAGAELLAIDDECGSSDIRTRKLFAAAIKSNLFAGGVRIEGKHRTAFTFAPVWRLVIALNDQPENLLVLPPLDGDFTAKLTLLLCKKTAFPMPCHTLSEREAFFGQLVAELPGLLDWLERWQPPEHLRDERCGIAHYHNPELLAALGELAPESELLALIDQAQAAGGIALPWEGTAAELRAMLTATPSTQSDARRLLERWGQAAGTYLGRLAGNGRIEKLAIRRGSQRWRILPLNDTGGGLVD